MNSDVNIHSVRSDRSTLILVLSILSLVIGCFPLGIVAWFMGSGDLKQMRAGTMDSAGESLTKVGMILGIISVILCFLFIIGVIIFFFLGMLASMLGAAGNPGFLLGL
ncbi:MAG: hypothetical protein MK095_08995 [Phycisphaerales bacterium]|nr:hypothetical protein [Phycisphaerales bacterium]